MTPIVQEETEIQIEQEICGDTGTNSRTQTKLASFIKTSSMKRQKHRIALSHTPHLCTKIQDLWGGYKF